MASETPKSDAEIVRDWNVKHHGNDFPDRPNASLSIPGDVLRAMLREIDRQSRDAEEILGDLRQLALSQLPLNRSMYGKLDEIIQKGEALFPLPEPPRKDRP